MLHSTNGTTIVRCRSTSRAIRARITVERAPMPPPAPCRPLHGLSIHCFAATEPPARGRRCRMFCFLVLLGGQVTGRVTDATTRAPLANVSVHISGLALAAETDSDGRYQILEVPAGSQRVVAHLLGYSLADSLVPVRDGATTVVDFQLHTQVATLNTVRVHGESPEHKLFTESPGIAPIELSAATIRSTPAALEPDPIRAAQTLPGVVTPSDRKVGFAVQGGSPDQNLVQLDGITLYDPDHFGGIFGTFIDGAVSRLDLFEAGYPAAYGGRMSSVLDVASTEDTRPGVHGDVNVSLLSSNATVGGSLGHGTWEVSARRTYADLLEPLVTRNVI